MNQAEEKGSLESVQMKGYLFFYLSFLALYNESCSLDSAPKMSSGHECLAALGHYLYYALYSTPSTLLM